MGGGDLNLKKSWHTGTLRNQEKVWKKEQEAEEERKKVEQLLKEKNEERQMLELQALNEATGKNKRRGPERLDWMYSAGPSGNQAVLDEDREAYLLGKKRVDKLVEQGKTVAELSAQEAFARSKATAYGLVANSVRDTDAKIREDPLFAIKMREQASLKAVLSNPLKVKEIKEGKKKKKKDKKEKKEKKDKKRRRSESGSESEEDRPMKGARRDSLEANGARGAIEKGEDRPVGHVLGQFRPGDGIQMAVIATHPSDHPGVIRWKEADVVILLLSDEADRRPRSPPHRRNGDIMRNKNEPRALARLSEDRGAVPPPLDADEEARRRREEDRERRIAQMKQDADDWDVLREKRVRESREKEEEETKRDLEARMKRLEEVAGGQGEGFVRDLRKQTFMDGDTSAADMIRRNRAFAQRGGGDGFMSKA
ncbi:RNA-splicing factor [Borealophlyctis nickersoniae]|nr:RNA-splicing factor [Borealophlyctis nickersoniae]